MVPVPEVCSDSLEISRNEVCSFYGNSPKAVFCFLVSCRTLMLPITFHVNNLDFTLGISRAVAQRVACSA